MKLSYSIKCKYILLWICLQAKTLLLNQVLISLPILVAIQIFSTSHFSSLLIIAGSGGEPDCLLEMELVRTVTSLITGNTKCNLCKVGESLKQHNISLTCFFTI